MPKRAYPFTESFSSQYKIHVGQNELCQSGVFGNKYRQEIYEKTKNLLFNGAKAVMGKIWTGEDKCTAQKLSDAEEITASSQSLLKGQTLIGQDGKLTKGMCAKGPSSGTTNCCVCLKSQGLRTPCSQCDRAACSSCTRQCSCCNSSCCSICTTIDYSGRYDEVICCGCST
ncbi:apoptosis regulatory protein Siva [Boleophthalmus pectinirostris]|uniref:apoptosis regulatory protein Siva n=1 Tax=Boleophthalmus pectinirostris TaxID=150288 RepID=UPI000A1C520D|nr:apoptosis regulatory protein Siva [Boleophthalmus pectinirostris]